MIYFDFYFLCRLKELKQKSSSFGIFVLNLCVADFLMGVYMTIICSADAIFRDTYLRKDEYWRNSPVCHLAGVAAFLSCEVSAFIICLITLDRFLVTKFPFSSLHFGTISSCASLAFFWMLATLLAIIPIVKSSWVFYSQTGVCFPLPVTQTDLPGYEYVIAIMIVLNTVLFLLVACGQSAIYVAIRLVNQITQYFIALNVAV